MDSGPSGDETAFELDQFLADQDIPEVNGLDYLPVADEMAGVESETGFSSGFMRVGGALSETESLEGILVGMVGV